MDTTQVAWAGGIMASNPFITQANPMMSQTLVDPDAQALQRQKQYAAMLLQQNQMPQGQMVSGNFVAPSWTEKLSSAINPLVGAYMMDKADTKQTELSLRQQQLAQKNIADALRLSKGGEETVYGAGMEGPTKEVKQIAPDSNAAIAQLLRPNATALETSLGGKLLERQFKDAKWEKVEKYDPKTGNTFTGMVDVNSANPESTFREIAVSKPAMSQKDMLELRDKGINVGGGMPTGAPMGVGQGSGQIVGDSKYMPATLPAYEYNSSLSPAQNRELQGQFAKDLQKNVKNAKDAFGTIKAVSDILGSNKPSSGLLENALTGTREMFGGGGEQSKADAQLKVLGQKLVQQVPRFEGPQSDKDVASYQAAAGDIGNANTPIATRMAALQTLVDLNKKYYPNGDWDSINLNAPVIKPNMFGGTNTYFGAKVLPRDGSAKPNLVYDPATGTFK